MTYIVSRNPLVRKVVDADAGDEILNLLMAKQLPLTEEDYLESLVFAMKDDRFKTKSIELLRAIPEPVKANYARKPEVNLRVVYYILNEALVGKSLKVISLIIHNRIYPVDFLIKIADRGNREMLEVLLENQIKMIAFPEIMEHIEKNSYANVFIKGKIREIRDFYLNQEPAEEISEAEILEDAAEIMAVAKSDQTESDDGEPIPEEIEETALSLLQIINNMSTAERIKLALTGSRSHRMILIKDPNKMVSMAVLESPKISVDEVLSLVRNRGVPTEVVTRISVNRDWTKNYEVTQELVMNPKTPVKNAMGFIKKLHERDLLKVIRERNISPVIRNLALNYHREKSKVKK